MTIQPATSLQPWWQVAPERVTLPPGEVHVWRAHLDVEPVVLRHLQETLSDDERARAERFYSPIHRERYAAGRGILRALLARYLEVPAVGLRFCYNPQGKPALVSGTGTQDLRFNLSHSQGLALYAFAACREVGVDVEYVRPFPKEERVADRFFSPEEVAELRALPVSAQAEAFFHCWTRKEAYIKARGGGLSISLASFTVSLAPYTTSNLPIMGHGGQEADGWSLRPLALGSDYAAALAAEGADWSVALWHWD